MPSDDTLAADVAEMRRITQRLKTPTGPDYREAQADGCRLAINLAPRLADEVDRLRAENEKLRAALKPFASAWAGECDMPGKIGWHDLKAAAAALEGRDNGRTNAG